MSAHPSADGGARRVVVVTGASSGIGRATAILLTRQGSHVVLASRSKTALVHAQAECVPGMTMVVPTDVSNLEQVQGLMDRALATYGRVDAVVHCAVVLAYGRFEDVPAEVFDRSINVTLTGTANVARASLQLFRKQGEGALVVVGSLLGKIATPYMSSYVTAKWAVHGLVRTLQIEARQTPGIQVSLVSPGGVDTPVYLQAGTYLGRNGRPPPPIVSPEQVAAVILRRIDRPARDSDVGPANGLTVLGFRALPGLFDRIVTPLIRAGGLSNDPVGPSAGNVFAPQPDGEAVHGQWASLSDGNISNPRSAASATESRPAPASHLTTARPVSHDGDADPDVDQDTVQQNDGEGRMRVTRIVQAPPAAVWAVLSDGWLYANWVVGASRVRSVDPGWPAVGSQIDHSFGMWPAVINDVTRCLEQEPERRLVLKAKGWPLGEARIEVVINELGDGRCRASVVEDAVAGPGLFVPKTVRQAAIAVRNTEALRRLALIAEGRPPTVSTVDKTPNVSVYGGGSVRG